MRRLWVALWGLYAAAVFALSQLPTSAGNPPFLHFDKCCHAAEFALFAALAWKATSRRALLSFAVTAAYAGSDELHQLFVATRTASFLDFAADLGGAAAALLVLSFASRLWPFPSRRILRRTHSKGAS